MISAVIDIGFLVSIKFFNIAFPSSNYVSLPPRQFDRIIFILGISKI